jgi:hypothetical protein
MEGVTIPMIEFSDPPKTVVLQPPPKWAVHGGGSVVMLEPPDRPGAGMELRSFIIKPEDPSTPDDIKAWTASLLPPDATKATLEGEASSPFTLAGIPSHEYTYTYVSQAQPIKSTIAIVNLNPTTRLAVIAYAHVGDFAKIYQTTQRCIFSWAWREGPAQ